MSEAKFTPGQWSVSIDDDGEYAITKNGSFITYAFPTELGFEDGTTEANAALIAAAPDLYEAIRHMQKIILDDDLQEMVPPLFWEISSAALAKARGE